MYLQTILIKPASSQCNMSCDYCFYCDEAAKREYGSYGMMSEETLRSLIKKVYSRQFRIFALLSKEANPLYAVCHFLKK